MTVLPIATTQSSLNRITTATIAGSPSCHNTLDEVDLLMPEGQHQQIKPLDPFNQPLLPILHDEYSNRSCTPATPQTIEVAR
jgi:hypothetical protein